MMLCNGCHFNMYPMCTILISYNGITLYNDLMHTSMLDCKDEKLGITNCASVANCGQPVFIYYILYSYYI